MTDARTLLEGKTQDELIDEVLQRRQEIADIETELAGAIEAEAISDAEADKYAALLREADYLLNYFSDPDKDRAKSGFPDVETFIAATKRHQERLNKYGAFTERQREVAAEAPERAATAEKATSDVKRAFGLE